MNLIEKWLSGNKNYWVGVGLYEAFGDNKALIQLLNKGETSFTKKELEANLRELLQSNPTIIKEETSVLDVSSPPKAAIKQVEAALQHHWKADYKRMCFKIAQLDAFGESNTAEAIAERLKLCEEIVALEQKVVSYFHKPNTEPEPDPMPIPTDPISLAQTIESCKRSIRRNRTKMATNIKAAEKYHYYKQYFKKLTGDEYIEKKD